MFLDRVRATGDWGNEAVEVAFQYVNDKIPDVNEVILIGDAPGNQDYQVESNRKRLTEDYWNKEGFPSTTTDKELLRLKDNNILVHGFYFRKTAFKKNDVKEYFEKVSKNL